MTEFRSIVQSLIVFSFWAISFQSQANIHFETNQGTGPDKWASVWLLTRFVDGAVVKVGLASDAGTDATRSPVLFDVNGSVLNRTGASTSYDKIISAYAIDDASALNIGTIVREIEIDAWKQVVSVESQQVEAAFRGMQMSFGRDKVTPGCYLAFFDNVAEFVATIPIKLVQSDTLIPDRSCLSNEPTTSQHDTGANVPLVDLATVAMHASLGANVAFLDTRESWEFDEGHIPGALNMPLRDITASSVAELLDKDLVIAYCVKDFRGYEAAKRLRGLGVEAAIMNPYGMRGWIAAGLPVAGSRGLPEQEARAALAALVETAVESRNGEDSLNRQ